MFKRHVIKLVAGLALILTLAGGVALGSSTSSATTHPTNHTLACFDPAPCI